MLASLPMYARPELEPALQQFWSLIRTQLTAQGIEAPVSLDNRGIGLEVWRRRDLLLSQTCSLPFRTDLHPWVQLVGMFDHGLAGCAPGHYRSGLVVRADDPRSTLATFDGSTLAFNDTNSQSGYAALFAHVETMPKVTFAKAIQTQSHRRAARAVADGAADIAAIDAVTWTLMTRYDRFTDRLRVLEWTQPTPALPMICSRSVDASALRRAIQTAIDGLDEDVRQRLMIHDFVEIPLSEVLAVPTPAIAPVRCGDISLEVT